MEQIDAFLLVMRVSMRSAVGAVLTLALCTEDVWSTEVETVMACTSWELGEAPKADVFVVDGGIEVTEVDGNRVLTVLPSPITDANAQLGVSAKGSASIQARVWSAKRARSYPRFGVGVHGISGYRLMVNPALKRLELVLGDEVLATVPYDWSNEAWMTLQLSATKPNEDDGQWTLECRAWADGAEVPAEPMMVHRDESEIRGSGKCSIWGTPYSEQPIHFDDLVLKVEVPDGE